MCRIRSRELHRGAIPLVKLVWMKPWGAAGDGSLKRHLGKRNQVEQAGGCRPALAKSPGERIQGGQPQSWGFGTLMGTHLC